MTVISAINAIDNVKPNQIAQVTKIKWLSDLDGQIKAEIIDTHENGDSVVFDGYTESDLQTELIAKAPYDGLYVKWLEAQIDYANNEYGKYNNSSIAFNEAYTNFANYYNRTNMPKGKKLKFF